MRGIPALPCLALILLVGCADAGVPASPAPPRTAAADGVQVELEAGWHAATESLTPKLLNPRELLSIGNFSMHPGGRCNHLPSRAYSEMGPRDGLITIMERRGNESGERNAYRQRPDRFDLDNLLDSFECTPPELDSHQFTFSDSGRNFYAFVALGSRGPEKEAESILNSFDASP